MHLKKLSLLNFKNYFDAEIELQPGVNAFVGDNGTGKTNLLDAIHYLSLCKSYFNSIDGQNIKQKEDFFLVQGIFDINESVENISCSFKKGQKKIFKRNKKEYDRLADHIGLLPVVMISPTDSGLITEGSEERRKFSDSIISQFDRIFLDDLMSYARVLLQRNSYLKQAAASRSFDPDTIEIWNDQLIPSGNRIYNARKKFIDELVPIFRYYYHFISGNKESVDIRYESHLNENNFSSMLCDSMERDKMLQFTSTGPHKDDLIFMINDFPVKRFASQGQQKSFLIALKLAQFDFIKKRKEMKPILLLDDIFDKLDDKRVSKLMELVSQENFGQIFITDTHPERLQEIFDNIKVSLKSFNVSDDSFNNSKRDQLITNEEKFSEQ
jgi:DNA replication and repair protein RecF